MSKQELPTTFIEKLKLRWYVILRDVLNLWVKPKVQADACTGCGLCVDFCPVGVLKMGDSIPKIIKLTACYDCGTCADLSARPSRSG